MFYPCGILLKQNIQIVCNNVSHPLSFLKLFLKRVQITDHFSLFGILFLTTLLILKERADLQHALYMSLLGLCAARIRSAVATSSVP